MIPGAASPKSQNSRPDPYGFWPLARFGTCPGRKSVDHHTHGDLAAQAAGVAGGEEDRFALANPWMPCIMTLICALGLLRGPGLCPSKPADGHCRGPVHTAVIAQAR